ncbi:hypothetical protein [Thalassospira lucentensis]|uniref:hypothetical protein n=1 Tax=Thalassospira lucentensis TaxID=168935 RepID=UPI003AA874F0
MVNIQGQLSFVGAQMMLFTRPIDIQTGEYTSQYSAEEWKELMLARQEEFKEVRRSAESNLANWLDDNSDAEVTRAYYLDGQLTAVFGTDNANVSNGINYSFDYRLAKDDGERRGLTGDKLNEYVENRIETALKSKYGNRLEVRKGPAGTMGTVGDYREELFGGERWPSIENIPQITEFDWNAPSPKEAGTWTGPIKLNTSLFLEMREHA